MEDCMRECMRKLALWHTRTFKPIMTHDELDSIMATLGFVALPPSAASASREYVFSAGGRRAACGAEPPPRPRLPYPRIDGLHIYTYRAFIDAVNFYLHMTHISDLFHIRGMPLHRVHDRNRKWRRMEEDDGVFVYREGTLNQATTKVYHFDKHNSNNNSSSNSCSGFNSVPIRDKGNNNAPISSLVPLKDIIV